MEQNNLTERQKEAYSFNRHNEKMIRRNQADITMNLEYQQAVLDSLKNNTPCWDYDINNIPYNPHTGNIYKQKNFFILNAQVPWLGCNEFCTTNQASEMGYKVEQNAMRFTISNWFPHQEEPNKITTVNCSLDLYFETPEKDKVPFSDSISPDELLKRNKIVEKNFQAFNSLIEPFGKSVESEKEVSKTLYDICSTQYRKANPKAPDYKCETVSHMSCCLMLLDYGFSYKSGLTQEKNLQLRENLIDNESTVNPERVNNFDKMIIEAQRLCKTIKMQKLLHQEEVQKNEVINREEKEENKVLPERENPVPRQPVQTAVNETELQESEPEEEERPRTVSFQR